VESPMEILHPKNIKNYLKTLSADDNLRRVLSSEFQGIVEAIKKTRSQFDQKEQKSLEAGDEP